MDQQIRSMEIIYTRYILICVYNLRRWARPLDTLVLVMKDERNLAESKITIMHGLLAEKYGQIDSLILEFNQLKETVKQLDSKE